MRCVFYIVDGIYMNIHNMHGHSLSKTTLYIHVLYILPFAFLTLLDDRSHGYSQRFLLFSYTHYKLDRCVPLTLRVLKCPTGFRLDR